MRDCGRRLKSSFGNVQPGQCPSSGLIRHPGRESGLLAHVLGLSLSSVEFSPPAPDFLEREAFDIAVIALPSRAGAPSQRRLYGGPWGWCSLDHLEGEVKGEGLRRGVVGAARSVPEREIREHKTRHAHILDNIFGATHHNGGDTVFFQ